MLLDQAGGSLKIRGSQRMLYGFSKHLVLFVPGAGTTMQFGHQRGLSLLEAALEHLCKQVVIAVPASLLVQRDHKQVGPVEGFQHRLAPLRAGDGVTERTTEALQDRGMQQKR